MEVVVREATADDAEALLAYATRLFSEELPGLYRRPVPTLEEEREFIRSYTGPSNSVLLVAEVGGKVAGLAGLLGRSLDQERHVGSVGVSVDRDHRAQGLGTRLLESIFKWAPAHGVSRVEIEAFANNPGAIGLYERVGFVREGVRQGAVTVDGEPVDVVCLAHWPLNNSQETT
jgi:RimJ/RimL family protein N-acetyltransferase